MSKSIKQLKQILKEELPTGSANLIKKRLAEKNINISEGHIRKVLDPENNINNKYILDEAFLLCKETLDNLIEIQDKKSQLQTIH